MKGVPLKSILFILLGGTSSKLKRISQNTFVYSSVGFSLSFTTWDEPKSQIYNPFLILVVKE